MKYLKNFENKNERKLKYKVGDYVLLGMLDVFDYDDCVGVISKIQSYINSHGSIKYDVYPYVITFYDGSSFDCGEEIISRKLTKKEIEEYNIKNNLFKYNL
jgi:hypothetical protein